MLNQAYPVNDAVIARLRILTEKDIASDPSWLLAPIVVCSNREKDQLQKVKAVAFAIANNTCVITWKHPLVGSNALKFSETALNILHKSQPELMGTFVLGAPAFLNNNLDCSHGLANGTPLLLHSLTLNPDDQPETYANAIADARPGQIVTIPCPFSVNVSVPSVDASTWNPINTLVPGQVVIPLQLKNPRKNILSIASYNLPYKSHLYDLAFAITFHKIQGQTVKKLILDLNQRPGKKLGSLCFHEFYVGLSRVKLGDDLRILPPHKENSFEYLKKLKPPDDLIQWLNSELAKPTH